MKHKEFVRIVPEADTAVLFIHGIVGTPNHFCDLIPLVDLVPKTWSVYNILLDGHGGSVDDFARTSMKKWKQQVWNVFEELCRNHDRVILAAHSMGTLFSLQLALEHPEKIPFLFLLAIPMRPGMRLTGIVNLLRMVFGFTREDHPRDVATRDVCGVTTTRKLWKYIKWLPRFLELFREIIRTEKVLRELKVPCTAYQSDRDELVMNCSRRVLEKSGAVGVYRLANSTHFYYHPDDQKLVREDFKRHCDLITHD